MFGAKTKRFGSSPCKHKEGHVLLGLFYEFIRLLLFVVMLELAVIFLKFSFFYNTFRFVVMAWKATLYNFSTVIVEPSHTKLLVSLFCLLSIGTLVLPESTSIENWQTQRDQQR